MKMHERKLSFYRRQKVVLKRYIFRLESLPIDSEICHHRQSQHKTTTMISCELYQELTAMLPLTALGLSFGGSGPKIVEHAGLKVLIHAMAD